MSNDLIMPFLPKGQHVNEVKKESLKVKRVSKEPVSHEVKDEEPLPDVVVEIAQDHEHHQHQSQQKQKQVASPEDSKGKEDKNDKPHLDVFV